MGMIDRITNSRVNVYFEIEELVLDGFTGQDESLVVKGLKEELTRLLSEGKLEDNFKKNKNIERLDGGIIQTRNGLSGGEIGKQIAQNLYGGMQ
jgi:hypothetical protein